jgi:hypothetical protein
VTVVTDSSRVVGRISVCASAIVNFCQSGRRRKRIPPGSDGRHFLPAIDSDFGDVRSVSGRNGVESDPCAAIASRPSRHLDSVCLAAVCRMIFTWKTDGDVGYFKRKRSKDRCTVSTTKRAQPPAQVLGTVGGRILSRSLTTRDDLNNGNLSLGVLRNRELLRREHSWSPSGKRGWSARGGK